MSMSGSVPASHAIRSSSTLRGYAAGANALLAGEDREAPDQQKPASGDGPVGIGNPDSITPRRHGARGSARALPGHPEG
jgi:hypothetical protein